MSHSTLVITFLSIFSAVVVAIGSLFTQKISLKRRNTVIFIILHSFILIFFVLLLVYKGFGKNDIENILNAFSVSFDCFKKGILEHWYFLFFPFESDQISLFDSYILCFLWGDFSILVAIFEVLFIILFLCDIETIVIRLLVGFISIAIILISPSTILFLLNTIFIASHYSQKKVIIFLIVIAALVVYIFFSTKKIRNSPDLTEKEYKEKIRMKNKKI